MLSTRNVILQIASIWKGKSPVITYLPYFVIAFAVILLLLFNQVQSRAASKHREETDQFMAALGQRISALEEEISGSGDRNLQLNDLKITQLRDELKTTLDNFRVSLNTRLDEHETVQKNRLVQVSERLSALKDRQSTPGSGYGQTKSAEATAPLRETPIHEKAKRLARLIVADIALYNGPAVEEGVRNNTFVKLLSHEIKEARALYAQRVSEDVRKDTTYLEDAFRELISRKKRELNI